MTKKRNPFDSAVDKGRKAYQDGIPIDDCPYEDHRKPSGKLSWSRAWIRAWQDGWQQAKAGDTK